MGDPKQEAHLLRIAKQWWRALDLGREVDAAGWEAILVDRVGRYGSSGNASRADEMNRRFYERAREIVASRDKGRFPLSTMGGAA